MRVIGGRRCRINVMALDSGILHMSNVMENLPISFDSVNSIILALDMTKNEQIPPQKQFELLYSSIPRISSIKLAKTLRDSIVAVGTKSDKLSTNDRFNVKRDVKRAFYLTSYKQLPFYFLSSDWSQIAFRKALRLAVQLENKELLKRRWD